MGVSYVWFVVYLRRWILGFFSFFLLLSFVYGLIFYDLIWGLFIFMFSLNLS